ncbi:hypothetical protein E3C22_16210 [Jiella endophytica]|uniref:Uncharacterized protein n=1 Tax=Jiella endophytica TaxID=2558362 RepID=A0A4Y8RDU0_9HYPH|nr:hypothetical protein [Jiella endophytica]TFF20455.1 hypothetical protein E3C22_16210 [Jiella endophytica]
MLQTVLLAGAIAIPFADTPQQKPTSSEGELARFETAFEFAEIPGGYRLNAIVIDLADGASQSTPIGNCKTINLDSFSEGLFGTPVVCNGINYSFDVRQGQIVVDASPGRLPAKVVRKLKPGHALINGTPLLIERGRAK